jgi:hypothetical protein
MKTNILAPKKVGDRQKDWAVEKALQLCFLRRDWKSFHNIIHAPSKKCDDLSDTIVQLEAFCHRFNFPVTTMPINWDTISPYVGWHSGIIFFHHLMVLIKVDEIASGIRGWINILQRYERLIKDERDNYVFDQVTHQLIHQPKMRIPITHLFPSDQTSFSLSSDISSYNSSGIESKDPVGGTVQFSFSSEYPIIQDDKNSLLLGSFQSNVTGSYTLKPFQFSSATALQIGSSHSEIGHPPIPGPRSNVSVIGYANNRSSGTDLQETTICQTLTPALRSTPKLTPELMPELTLGSQNGLTSERLTFSFN